MSKSINLIYSGRRTNFFGSLRTIREITLKYKYDDVINDFSATDEMEVQRGNSYAVFPELKDTQITLTALREALKARGITDLYLQNKVLGMLIQSKSGIHFALGNVINTLLMENNHPFILPSNATDNYNVHLEVKNNNQVKLIFTANWQCYKYDPRPNSIGARVEVDITPNKIAITNFTLTQLDDKPETKEAFTFLEQNQANILQKIIMFLKNFFNIDNELVVENVAVDHKPWSANTKKYADIQAPAVKQDEQEEQQASDAARPK